MAHKFLEDKVIPLDVEKTETVSDILTASSNTPFQSRSLARCVEIFIRMLKDSAGPTIFLGLAGAMIPAGMKKVISSMIRKRMVRVIVTTGANPYHDLVEAFCYHHYKVSPGMDDAELRKHRVDRIHDTYPSES